LVGLAVTLPAEFERKEKTKSGKQFCC
jgi:hypothetical protein